MTGDTRFATRPSVPEAGSDEEARWKKMATVAYDGGYIHATYGNLTQTFALSGKNKFCLSSVDVERAAYTVQRTLTIGTDSKEVKVPASRYKRWPRRNGSNAAAGEPYTFKTDIGSYTARVGGDVQSLLKALCDSVDQIYGTLWIYSDRGAEYGPISAASNPDTFAA